MEVIIYPCPSLDALLVKWPIACKRMYRPPETKWTPFCRGHFRHYSDVMMYVMASKITGVSIVYSTVCTGPDQRKHRIVGIRPLKGIHRWPVNSPHKGTIMRKMFPFDDVIPVHFLDRKCLYSDIHFTEVCSQWSNRIWWQYRSTLVE